MEGRIWGKWVTRFGVFGFDGVACKGMEGHVYGHGGSSCQGLEREGFREREERGGGERREESEHGSVFVPFGGLNWRS